METHVFRLVTMHCADCAALVDETLAALPGVCAAHATVPDRQVEVTLDPATTGPDAVVAALTGLGFRMRPAPKAPPPAVPVGSQVSDAAWAVLSSLLGPSRGSRDQRRLVEGVAYKLRADVAWREVPAQFGPWQTLYARWSRWRADGTWHRMADAARAHPELAAELTWLTATAAPPPARRPDP
ncbi:transposase [Actinophytocola sp. KF-1]